MVSLHGYTAFQENRTLSISTLKTQQPTAINHTKAKFVIEYITRTGSEPIISTNLIYQTNKLCCRTFSNKQIAAAAATLSDSV